MNNKKLIILSAPSGAGKTTLIEYLLKKNTLLEFSISCTTRAPRKYELNGKDYYFLDLKEFKNKINNNEFYYSVKDFINKLKIEKGIKCNNILVKGSRAIKLETILKYL